MSAGLDDSGGSEVSGVLSWFPIELPARQRVLGLFVAKWVIGALRPLVQLKIPDLLADGPRTAGQLAETTGADPDSLYRALRCVAAAGILREPADGTFALTAAADGLRSDVDDGVRDMFLFTCDPMMWRPYEDMLHTVRTGEPAFDNVFGAPFFDFLRENAGSAALFDRAMTQNHYPGTDRVFEQFDFSRFPRIADVGGGRGQFLAEVLSRHPGCTGAVCDQPQVVAEAKAEFERRDVADRASVVETDFFAEIPAGFDAYFIKHTLHNWNDRDAVRILERVRAAIGDDADARLLIVDMLLTGPGEWDLGKLTDIEMMAALGGRERGLAEWNRVAGAAGFVLANDPVPGDLALLEFRPV
ncbi:MAG: ArsR family transcriptional regulator [Actinophytocola sp.]|uniref:ArsR family transcriptional regulator n=1 Tax=Actinophytocola sp. TaxID=1872138 RepID=UPI003C7887B9